MKLFRLWMVDAYETHPVFRTMSAAMFFYQNILKFDQYARIRHKRVGLIQWLKGEW